MKAWALEIRAAVVAATTNRLNVSGRASVYEYWNWALVCFVVTMLLAAFEVPRVTDLAWQVLMQVSVFTAAVRRMHDSDRSGYMVLTGYVPWAVGLAASSFLDLSEATSIYVNAAALLPGLYFLYLLTSPGDEVANEFGPPSRQTLALLRRLRERQDTA